MAQLLEERKLGDILKTNQQKAVSTGFLTFVLLVILLIGSFRPTVKTISEARRKVDNRERALRKLTEHNAALTSLKEQQLKLDTELSALNYYFPSDGDFSLFITNLNEMALENNLILEAISFSNSYNDRIENIASLQYEEMTPVTFQIALRGAPEDLSTFLAFAENTPFLPKVLSISYSPNRVLSQETSLSVTLLVYKMNSPATGYD